MVEENKDSQYTDIQLQFLDLLKKYPVKTPETVVDYVTSQGETVLEDPEKLAQALSECEISPVRRRQVLKHWFAEKGVDVTPELLQKVTLPPERRKEAEEQAKAEEESKKAKYSVDEDTGAIKVATTGEKALTWPEAEKLSKQIKKEIAERGKGKEVRYVYDADAKEVRMAKEGEVGGTLEQAKELKKMAEEGKGKEAEEQAKAEEESKKAKYSVDEDTGAIKVATTGEKALTWPEAEKLSKSIKKEIAERGKGKEVRYVYDADAKEVRMAKEGEIGGTLEQAKELKKMAEEGKGKEAEESPFIQDDDGNLAINPKAKITGVELLAWNAIKRAQEKGEALDPLEAIAQAAERMKVYQEALGGGGRALPDWMSDPAKFLETVEKISGGGKGDEALKQQVASLEKTLTDMKEDRYKEQIGEQKKAITTLANKVTELTDHVTDLSKPATGRTEMDIIHEIATEGIGVLKSELPGLRRDVKEAIGSTVLPPAKSPGERKERTAKLRQAVEKDKDIEEIGRRLFFRED